MCSRARCMTCGKTTWSGCGAHVEQVMRSVPAEQRCTCSPDQRAPQTLLSRLLGRRG